jgi:hypothetical protein
MLPGDYVAGFIDGEGCFSLKLHRDVKRNRVGSPVYLHWKAEFCIVLRKDDSEILEKIREALGCGKVYLNGRFARYSVQDRGELISKVIPFFAKFPLRAKKQNDFKLWSESVKILEANAGKGTARHLKEIDEVFEKLRAISEQLTHSRSSALAEDVSTPSINVAH